MKSHQASVAHHLSSPSRLASGHLLKAGQKTGKASHNSQPHQPVATYSVANSSISSWPRNVLFKSTLFSASRKRTAWARHASAKKSLRGCPGVFLIREKKLQKSSALGIWLDCVLRCTYVEPFGFNMLLKQKRIFEDREISPASSSTPWAWQVISAFSPSDLLQLTSTDRS